MTLRGRTTSCGRSNRSSPEANRLRLMRYYLLRQWSARQIVADLLQLFESTCVTASAQNESSCVKFAPVTTKCKGRSQGRAAAAAAAVVVVDAGFPLLLLLHQLG